MKKIPVIPGDDMPGDIEATVVAMMTAHRHHEFPPGTQSRSAMHRAICTIASGVRNTNIEAWEEFFSRKVEIIRESFLIG